MSAHVLVLLVATGPGAVAGQEEWRECCPLLLMPVGARSSAMGGAVTARIGPDAVFRNPAGLVGLTGTQFTLHHSDRGMVDVNAFSLVATPLNGAAALSYQLFDNGTLTATDPTGEVIGEITYRDHLIVGSLALPLGSSMAVGASYKLFQERIDCRGACGGAERVTAYHAVDIGYRFSPQRHPALQFGVVAANIAVGTPSDENAGALPGRLHVGLAYDVLRPFWGDDALGLHLAVDLQDELRRLGSVVPSVGVELDMQQALFLRAGYTLGDGLVAGASIGVELRYDRFDIGVSRSFVNTGFDEDEPFQITFSIRF